MAEFREFPKIARYSREVIVTEKIDGTNACIYNGDDGEFLVGSRTKWITPDNDNHGFARWAYDHKEHLQKLGPGRHFGEWWGRGVQRGYGVDDKRLSLFNVSRWHLIGEEPKQIPCADPRIVKMQDELPPGIGLVPIIWRGVFEDCGVSAIMAVLRENGSYAAPGYMNPEGIVIYHVAGSVGFKKTLGGDGHKGK